MGRPHRRSVVDASKKGETSREGEGTKVSHVSAVGKRRGCVGSRQDGRGQIPRRKRKTASPLRWKGGGERLSIFRAEGGGSGETAASLGGGEGRGRVVLFEGRRTKKKEPKRDEKEREKDLSPSCHHEGEEKKDVRER